jgi:hypothetical protein
MTKCDVIANDIGVEEKKMICMLFYIIRFQVIQNFLKIIKKLFYRC